MSDSLRPHGLKSAKLLCPWDSPDKNTRVGSLSLLQERMIGTCPKETKTNVNGLLMAK